MLGKGPTPVLFPTVSVLIPARNEAIHINDCLASLSRQDYPDFTVTVLDDGSEDGTADLVTVWTGKDSRFRLIKGRPLPSDWSGKNWACHQLSQQANGKILIFTDADNTFAPDAITKTVGWMLNLNLALFSAFPQQYTKSLAEKLIVPIFDNFVYSLLPMWLSYYAPYTSLSAANGQWMGLTRKAYDQIGGHQAVQKDLVEDVALARLVKRNQLKILTATGKGTVFGHMYHNWTEVINGFSKNAFGLTDFNAFLFFFLLILMFGAHVLPYLLWITHMKYWALSMIILNSSIRGILAVKYSQPFWISILLNPVGILCMIRIAIRSYICYLRGHVIWKGRKIRFNKNKT
jgi:chlorobactene glucosyltransferase